MKHLNLVWSFKVDWLPMHKALWSFFSTDTLNLLLIKGFNRQTGLFLMDCWHITSTSGIYFSGTAQIRFLRPIKYYHHLSQNIFKLKMPACAVEYRLKTLKLEVILKLAWPWTKVWHETSYIFPKLSYFPIMYILI